MLPVKRLLPIAVLFVFSITIIKAQTLAPNLKSLQSHFKMPENIKKEDYLAKTVVIKVKSAFASVCSSNSISNTAFNDLFSGIGGIGLVKKFPFTKASDRQVNERGEHLTDLSLIYEFHYSASVDLEKVINRFISLGIFEYAEPHYIPHLCYTPNDPSLGMQYAITQIQAPAGWGVNTTTAHGDTNVVIGITDTGTDPTHSDLAANIKHNYADPIGGGDTDGDGYPDNFTGWDLGDNDNDPTWTGSQHGVHVCGIADAVTDNSNGIAGVGFNCKFLPVKIADATGTLTKAYEGITYAADHGCAIINCSWGGSAGGSLGQDVINYATINKNALVVAAAGNNSSAADFYPASFQYVISVANTDNSDVIAASSDYGYNIDVCAPGEGIYSTFPPNTYSTLSGTSMASPCAAGAAAIIKSFYPSYNALQIGEQLKVTCDNIYPANTSFYAYKLGNGRVNLFKALTQTSPSVVTTIRNITDNNDEIFMPNDTLSITGSYTNYLSPAANVIATLTTTSPYVTILYGSTTLGPMGTMGAANNNTDPFRVRILPTAPVNTVALLKITFTDAATSYTHTEYFTETINVDYINIAINDVATTITSKGKIGYRNDSQTSGLGFTYNGGGTILYESGLMIGVSGAQVSDVVRGTSGTTSDDDFTSSVRATQIIPSVISQFDVDGKFNDNTAGTPLPITVHHKAFAWTSPGNRKYVIVQYVISNTGTTALTNLYAGIFADWDIDASTYASNRVSFDPVHKMGYAYYTGTAGVYAGIKLLTNTAPVVHYAIDNVTGGAGGVDLNTGGFDGTEKYTTLSTNRPDAGVGGAGADIADVVSTGPYNIAIGDSIKVAFAILAGDSLADLQNSAVNAQTMYDGMTSTTVSTVIANDGNMILVYPNPANGTSAILINIAETANVELKVLNILGEEIKTIASEKLQSGSHNFEYDTSVLSSGLYYYQVTIGNKKYIQKLMVTK